MCLADARHISLPLITLWFLLLFLGWCILPGPPTVVFGFSFSLCLRDTACLIQNCHRRSVSSPKHVGTCYSQISSDQVTFCATDTFGRLAFDSGWRRLICSTSGKICFGKYDDGVICFLFFCLFVFEDGRLWLRFITRKPAQAF